MKKTLLIIATLFISLTVTSQNDLIINSDWTSSQISENFGTITIGNAGVTFTVDDNQTVVAAIMDADNNLTMDIKPGAELIINSDFIVKNNITIYLQGTLTINGNVQIKNNAELDIESTGSMSVDGSFEIQSGIITNDGTVDITGQYSGPAPSGSGTMTDTDETIQGSTLPVELLFANAKADNNRINMNWTTAAEINNDYFTILLSTNMENWEEVAQIDGNGNSSRANEYNYSFIPNANGEMYIRLQQTDFDGTTEILKIFALQLNEASYSIYPQPAKAGQAWHISGISSTDKIQVFNTGMQPVEDYENLSRGFYYVVINNNHIEKLIVR